MKMFFKYTKKNPPQSSILSFWTISNYVSYPEADNILPIHSHRNNWVGVLEGTSIKHYIITYTGSFLENQTAYQNVIKVLSNTPKKPLMDFI